MNLRMYSAHKKCEVRKKKTRKSKKKSQKKVYHPIVTFMNVNRPSLVSQADEVHDGLAVTTQQPSDFNNLLKVILCSFDNGIIKQEITEIEESGSDNYVLKEEYVLTKEDYIFMSTEKFKHFNHDVIVEDQNQKYGFRSDVLLENSSVFLPFLSIKTDVNVRKFSMCYGNEGIGCIAFFQNFVQTKEKKITEDNLRMAVTTSKLFGCDGMSEACINFAKEKIGHDSDFAFIILQASIHLHDSTFISDCVKSVCENILPRFFKGPGITACVDSIEMMVQSNVMSIDEDTLFSYIVDWINTKTVNVGEQKSILVSLLPFIRFPTMTADGFVEHANLVDNMMSSAEFANIAMDIEGRFSSDTKWKPKSSYCCNPRSGVNYYRNVRAMFMVKGIKYVVILFGQKSLVDFLISLKSGYGGKEGERFILGKFCKIEINNFQQYNIPLNNEFSWGIYVKISDQSMTLYIAPLQTEQPDFMIGKMWNFNPKLSEKHVPWAINV